MNKTELEAKLSICTARDLDSDNIFRIYLRAKELRDNLDLSDSNRLVLLREINLICETMLQIKGN